MNRRAGLVFILGLFLTTGASLIVTLVLNAWSLDRANRVAGVASVLLALIASIASVWELRTERPKEARASMVLVRLFDDLEKQATSVARYNGSHRQDLDSILTLRAELQNLRILRPEDIVAMDHALSVRNNLVHGTEVSYSEVDTAIAEVRLLQGKLAHGSDSTRAAE